MRPVKRQVGLELGTFQFDIYAFTHQSTLPKFTEYEPTVMIQF